jgi:DNA-binding IclR family transcriptional regulator
VEPPADLESFTPHTITNTDQLRKNLEQIRTQGYAVDDEEFDLGVRCIAVPVEDFHGKVIASMGISGPASRMTPEKLLELAAIVLEVGKALSKRMIFTH